MTFVARLNELHDQAMEFSQLAFVARFNGDEDRAKQLTRHAFDLEVAAAKMIMDVDIEPSRSVLHRSAATLALDCGELRTAERLIAIGLAGDPPEPIAQELRDLWKQVLEQMTLKQAAGD